jgi:hypothetical protein
LILFDDLLLKLGSSASLLLSLIEAALVLCLLLLVTDHLLDASSLELLLLSLHVDELSLFPLFHLDPLRLLELFLEELLLGHGDVVLEVELHALIALQQHALLELLLPLALLLNAHLLLVALLHTHNVLGLLLGLLDFLPRLATAKSQEISYLLLLHLEERDAVSQQLYIVLSLLAGNAGPDELLGRSALFVDLLARTVFSLVVHLMLLILLRICSSPVRLEAAAIILILLGRIFPLSSAIVHLSSKTM